MITLKQFMEIVDYRITEGSEYGWACFGPTAYQIDSWDNNQNGVSASIVFDTITQEVFYAEVHDYATSNSYCLVNPKYERSMLDEAEHRGVSTKFAYDFVEFNVVKTDAEFINKATAIMKYQPYIKEITDDSV